MHDPTRIEKTLSVLQDAWEGRPGESLATIFAQLAERGIGWGTSDEDLVSALEEMSRERPALLPTEGGLAQGCWLVSTQAPTARVMVYPERIVVRSFRDNGGQACALQPVVWDYSRLRPTGPARPLVVADAEGIEHRLGVCEFLQRVDNKEIAKARELLSSATREKPLRRRDVGDVVWVIKTNQGETLVLGHGLRVYSAGRRDLQQRSLRWEKIEQCRPGEQMVVGLPGGEVARFGAIEDVLVAEC
ncbi:hypothetical protein ACUY2E_02895 [Corynebacterium confusum]|uniref:hypothetical protein n=1 Tax=uncultured Corynebacterium sp. TaxID=159447 RepID=UPI0025DF1162|nr:hypothetical protein [uncultured Corynebacterium sp.]